MSVLIAIHSCSADIKNGRHNAIRETWMYEAVKHADVRFFVGRENDVKLIGDEVQVDATEHPDNLVDKEAAMLRWAVNQGYQRILKTETDVYFNIRRLFEMNYERADVIGRYVGQWGNYYGDSNMYAFIQGHACWYSAKAATIIGGKLRNAYDALHPHVRYKVGQIDPSLRAADLWTAQLLTPYWRDKDITVDIEPGFAYGPRSWHLTGDNEAKRNAPEWIRKMHREHNAT